jgi:hypothetical protein
MAGFARSSSSALLALALVLGCTEELAPIAGTSSLRVSVLSPEDLGTPDARLDDDARAVRLRLQAIDLEGALDTGFTGQIDIYAHHLGSLTPPLGSGQALASLEIEGGVADGVELELPRVFGPTFLWAENVAGATPTFATGTSDTLWYRDPYIAEVSRPVDESRLDALSRSPLETKQVIIGNSRYGARGRLLVTGSYAQGYTISDVECQDEAGTPPCTTGDNDHVFVYTFSRPEAEVGGGTVQAGHLVDAFSGVVSEYLGLTEIGFPQTFLVDRERRPELIPAPVVLQPGWLDSRIELERVESGLVAVDNGTVCPLDAAFDTYGQWKLDIGRGCGSAINVATSGQVAELDPRQLVGQQLARVVGTLRPVNDRSNVWIIYPRSIDDLVISQ